jgi:putative nucleotidyltransferase with HDIG domain
MTTKGTPGRAQFWASFGQDGAIDWPEVERRLPFVPAMQDCVQDAVFHAEGDVWTHTRMVVTALLRSTALAGLAPERRSALLLAGLLHDIAKPATRSEEVDAETGQLRVHHYGHSRLGAIMAWEHLWREGVARTIRERVYHLVRWHQRPFHLALSPDVHWSLIQFSLLGGWRELIALAHADNAGRIAPNQEVTALNLDLLAMQAEEHGCLDGSWPFPSDAARVWFCRKPGRSPFFDPPAPRGSRVVVLSGLPGAGKDTYARARFGAVAHVSLDSWRARLGIAPDETQGKVIRAALEEARVHLRARQPFVWNATNITRLTRDRVVELCLDYDAHVEIHALDTPADRVLAQNRQRQTSVPESVIERLIEKWEPPSVMEAHALQWVE